MDSDLHAESNVPEQLVLRIDRLVAVTWCIVASARCITYLATYWSVWRIGLSRSNTMLFEWLSGDRAWPGIAGILLVAVFSIWAAWGTARSRGWSFVVVAYLSAIDVVAQLGRRPSTNPIAHFGAPLYVLFFLYCGLRVVGTFGPRIDVA